MEFWTVMWITALSTAIEGSTTGIPYPSMEACMAAVQPVTLTLAYDHNVICEETTTMSRIVRPRPRPEGLGE